MASFESDKATTTTASASTGYAARTGSVAAPTTADASRPTLARTGSVAATTTADAGKPAEARAGNTASAPTTADAGKPVLARSGAIADAPTTSNAVLVPGDFRPVDVTVVDPDGEPLGGVEWLTALFPFPATAGIDDDGRGTLPLLSASYTNFRAIASREGSDGVQYAWFEGIDNVIAPDEDEATIVVNPVEIKGLWAGAGADFGGMLG